MPRPRIVPGRGGWPSEYDGFRVGGCFTRTRAGAERIADVMEEAGGYAEAFRDDTAFASINAALRAEGEYHRGERDFPPVFPPPAPWLPSQRRAA